MPDFRSAPSWAGQCGACPTLPSCHSFGNLPPSIRTGLPPSGCRTYAAGCRICSVPAFSIRSWCGHRYGTRVMIKHRSGKPAFRIEHWSAGRKASGSRSVQPGGFTPCFASSLSISSMRSRCSAPFARPFRRHSDHRLLRSDASALRYRSPVGHFRFLAFPWRARRTSALPVFTRSSSASLRHRAKRSGSRTLSAKAAWMAHPGSFS